jgi:hypothetical protein
MAPQLLQALQRKEKGEGKNYEVCVERALARTNTARCVLLLVRTQLDADCQRNETFPPPLIPEGLNDDVDLLKVRGLPGERRACAAADTGAR